MQKIIWVKIYHSYKRTSDLRAGSTVTSLGHIERNFKSLNAAIQNEFKNWSGCGEIIISSIECGPYLEDEIWGEKMALKFKNQKIKFNN
ncbi:MAG: hypothetical protein RLZZ418_167 [Pseudomonadota bacterium]